MTFVVGRILFRILLTLVIHNINCFFIILFTFTILLSFSNLSELKIDEHENLNLPNHVVLNDRSEICILFEYIKFCLLLQFLAFCFNYEFYGGIQWLSNSIKSLTETNSVQYLGNWHKSSVLLFNSYDILKGVI